MVLGHDQHAPNETAYASRAKLFAKQIRDNSDIPVKIAFASWANSSCTGDGWNDPATAVKNMILNATTSDGVLQIDAFSYHHYPSWPLGDAKTMTPEVKIANSAYHQSVLKAIRDAITANTAKNIEVWNTEFFSHYYDSRDQSLFGALYGIDGQMYAARNNIPLTVPFCMWHGNDNVDQFFYLGDPGDAASKRPAWYRWLAEVWAKNWGDEVVSTTLSGAPVKTVRGSATTVSMEAIQVVTAKSGDGSKLYVMILNRTADTPVAFNLSFSGFTYNSNPIHYFKMKPKAGQLWTATFNPNDPPFTLEHFTNGTTSMTSDPASVMLLIIPSDAAAPPPSPSISSFTPTSGVVGMDMTINGSNFSSILDSNVVRFNGTQAVVKSASTTQIVATVPSGATTGTITVTVGTQTGTSGSNFTVSATPTPSITSFDPTSGYPGQSVKIRGSNFGATPAENIVKFNGKTAVVTAASATELTATIPDGATDGTISVTVNGQTGTSGSTFDVTAAPSVPAAPTISSFTPTSGTPGTAVVISGSNYATTPENNTVKFNGVVAIVESASADQLAVIVPSGSSTGRITVTVQDQTATSSTDFKVDQPAASDNVFAVRQTVAAGRLGTDGRPNFLEAGTGLSVKMLGAQAPVVLVFAYGNAQGGPLDYIGSVIDDASILFSSLPASATSYLYVNRDPASGGLSPGSSTIKPVYAPKEPSSPSVGMHWFNTASGLMLVCTDATTGGTQRQDVSDTTGVISGGDATGMAKANAFDGSTTTQWGSSQTGTSVFANAYIGDHFGGTSYTIKDIMLNQAAWPNRVSDAKFQVSDDGTNWTNVQTYTGLVSGPQTLSITSPVAGKYARLLANGSCAAGENWRVVELEFRADITLPGTAAWSHVQRLFVGEAVTNASAVTSVKTYALKGRDQTGRFAVTGGSNQTINHNLGTDVAIPRIGLAATADAILDLDAATNPNLDRNTLTFGVPLTGYVEADVVVERAF